MSSPRRLALFVWYATDGIVSETDRYLLEALAKVTRIVLVANGEMTSESRRAVKPFVKKFIFRKNAGYDFGAWRDALRQLGGARAVAADYDELVLLNNSVIGPFRPFSELFAKMAARPVDFWGLTAFPETRNSRREEAKALPEHTIPRHIQSYFTVFRKKALASEAFAAFWEGVKDETSLPEVVAKCETQLSGVLEKAGLKSDVYLRTAERLQNLDPVTPEWNAIYCRPQDFLALGFPFLKKNICYYQSQPEINETIHLISRLSDYPVNDICITARKRG